jgi:hypothetical protein
VGCSPPLLQKVAVDEPRELPELPNAKHNNSSKHTGLWPDGYYLSKSFICRAPPTAATGHRLVASMLLYTELLAAPLDAGLSVLGPGK